MPKGTSLVVDGVDVVAEVHEVLDRMSAFCRSGSLGRVERPHREADQEHRQRRHRRLRPRAGDGLRGSSPLQPAGHDLPVRLERRLHRFRRGHPRPRRRRDAVHRLLEDVHHARDDDERPLGREWARGRTRRRERDREAFRRRVHQRRRGRRVRDRHGQHVRLLGLGRRALLDGLGDRALDHDRGRARELPRSCSTASTPWTSIFARLRSSGTSPS